MSLASTERTGSTNQANDSKYKAAVLKWAQTYEWSYGEAIIFLCRRYSRSIVGELMGLDNYTFQELKELVEFIDKTAIELGIPLTKKLNRRAS